MLGRELERSIKERGQFFDKEGGGAPNHAKLGKYAERGAGPQHATGLSLAMGAGRSSHRNHGAGH